MHTATLEPERTQFQKDISRRAWPGMQKTLLHAVLAYLDEHCAKKYVEDGDVLDIVRMGTSAATSDGRSALDILMDFAAHLNPLSTCVKAYDRLRALPAQGRILTAQLLYTQLQAGASPRPASFPMLGEVS